MNAILALPNYNGNHFHCGLKNWPCVPKSVDVWVANVMNEMLPINNTQSISGRTKVRVFDSVQLKINSRSERRTLQDRKGVMLFQKRF